MFIGCAGYMFPNAHSIRPYLEHPHHGPTALYCSDLALSLRCYVTAGYPERLSPNEVELSAGAASSLDVGRYIEIETEKIGANIAVLYGPDGKWIGGYRKTNLFNTDLTCVNAGTCFSAQNPLSS